MASIGTNGIDEMKISEKLLHRISKELGFDIISIERIRRGKHGIAGGTWAWTAKTECGAILGSEDTMERCVLSKELQIMKRPREKNKFLVYAFSIKQKANK